MTLYHFSFWNAIANFAKSQKSKATLPKMVSVTAPGKVINIVINIVEGMIYVINRLSTYLST